MVVVKAQTRPEIDMSIFLDMQVVTRYGPTAGGDRVRVFDWLNQTGLAVPHFSFDPDPIGYGTGAVLRRPLRNILQHQRARQVVSNTKEDVITLLYKELSPFSTGGLEEALARRSRALVLDLDDALFLERPENRSFARSVISLSKKIHRVANSSDRIIAGNSYIADWASTACRDVRIIPSCVSPEDYGLKENYDLNDPPRAVWIGSPTTETHLGIVTDALVALNRSHGLRLTVISAGNGALGELESIADRVNWTPQSNSTIRNFDFGLMPLLDGPFERGKCGYKLLQYGAAGLPSTGSPVGVNAKILTAFGSSAPTNDRDYYDAILAILEAPASERKQMGRTARATVETGYSFSAWEEEWLNALGFAK